jgi:hypothetical protein
VLAAGQPHALHVVSRRDRLARANVERAGHRIDETADASVDALAADCDPQVNGRARSRDGSTRGAHEDVP